MSFFYFIQTQKYKNEFLGCKKIISNTSFFNTFIKKPEIKKLSNVKLLQELPFYDVLNAVKSSNAFSGYTRSYKVEIVHHKDPLVQSSKSSIEDLFKDVLDEMKGFNYQITVTVLLSKGKINRSIEYLSVYFNSTTKTVTNSEFVLIFFVTTIN